MADKFADNYSVPMPGFPAVGVVLHREFAYAVAAALALNDILYLCKIPGAGAPLIIDEIYVDIPDLDTGAALALSMGDVATPGKFIAIQTAIGQGPGKFSLANVVAGSLPVQYTTNENLIIKVTTGPGTGATGVTIKGWMEYHMIGAPSPV